MCDENSGSAVGGEVLLAGVEQPVDPAELVLGAVVRVQDDASAVGLGQRVDVAGAGDRAEDRRPVTAPPDPCRR